MKIRAVRSFCGALTMSAGEVRDCDDEAVLADLMAAGYVQEVAGQSETAGKTSRRRTRKNEGQ